MKWVLSHTSHDHHKWLLQESNNEAQFTYHLQHHSIRIKSKSNRLFFLELAGLFRKKVILRSEYGVVLGGTLVPENQGENTLSLNDFRFFYQWRCDELLLFDKARHQLASVTVEKHDKLDRLERFAIVFCQSWLSYSRLHQKTEDQLVA